MATSSYTLGGAMPNTALPKKTATTAAVAPAVKPPAPVIGTNPLPETVTAAPKTIKPFQNPTTPNIAPTVPTGTGPNITPSVNPQTPTGPNIAPTVNEGVTAGPGTVPFVNPGVQPPSNEGIAIGPGQQSFTNPGVVGPNIQPPAPGNLGAINPITTFSADNNLINAQVNPAASGRTGDTMSAVDAARNALSGGPNRSDLAAQYIDQWNQSTEPQYQKDLTDATKLAAANGRLGSGMLSTSYGDIALARDNARQVAQRGFQTDALSGTIQDRLNNLGALSGLESQQYGQDAANRNEVRGERGYQQGLSQQAFSNDAQRLALEEALTQGSYGRSSDRLNQLIQLGFQGNPGALALGASGQVQQGANQSSQGVADLLAQYFLGKNAGG